MEPRRPRVAPLAVEVRPVGAMLCRWQSWVRAVPRGSGSILVQTFLLPPLTRGVKRLIDARGWYCEAQRGAYAAARAGASASVMRHATAPSTAAAPARTPSAPAASATATAGDAPTPA